MSKMIQFFDIHTGTVYNGDYPYIHWAEPFSVGVIRYKELFFLSDKPTVKVNIKKPDDWTFALYSNDPIPITHIEYDNDGNEITVQEDSNVDYDDNAFVDIRAHATGSIVLSGHSLNDKYAYQLIIICRSDVEGEFIEDFTIDGLPYKVGAEFWGENESLRINLANQGTELPELIGRAIYGTDLYEDNPDWVLLNRKFRELLIQHMDVMDNKGSYKSLLNVLKWFEYQDLVELREVWKFQTPDGAKYYDHPLDSFITDEAKARMFNSSKTTYLALRQLKRTVIDGKGTLQNLIKYEHDPLEGELKILTCKWAEEEMRMKMVLLGNFFETYFMPIHADLIRSVIEDIHATVIKIQTGTMEDVHEECYTEANDFDFDWSGDTPDNPDDPDNNSFYLKEIHAYAGTSNEQYTFENATEIESNKAYEMDFVPIIGCTQFNPDGYKSDVTDDKGNAQLFNLMRGQLYNGIGAIVTGHFKFEEEIVSGECESNQWGNFVKTTFVADGSKSEFDINFLFPAPGNFKFIFRFVGKSGKVYSKIANITITNNLVVDLEFYALIANTDRGYTTQNPFVSEPEAQYMFSRTKERNHTLEDSVYNLNDGTTIPATNLILDSDWGQYSQIIPIRESKDKSFHWQAPYMTKVRKVFFTGPNAVTKCGAYMTNLKIDDDLSSDNYWCEKVTNETGEIQLRYCSKFRDVPLPINVRSADYTVVDSDVFFPELHTLMKVRGNVYDGFPIICRPVLRFANTNERVNYSDLIAAKDFSWEFYSWGVQRNINEIVTSSDDALMSWNYAVRLPCGYYTVTFRYKFGNEDVILKKQTPFRLVNEFSPLSHA